ncbi:hypothetical protein AWV80_00265 [Cupriavidus sp. UYMU48A]|nr:hypothetical protein AWV80_00265 [Cupriavidus sp. UYMU48A]
MVAGFSRDLWANAHQQFADDIEQHIERSAADIPVYRLYSDDYQRQDRSFFEAAAKLGNWVAGEPALIAALNKQTGKREQTRDYTERVKELRAKCRFCLDSALSRMSVSDDLYEDTKAAYGKAADRVLSLTRALTRQLISLELTSRDGPIPTDLFRHASVREMVGRLYPLQLFLDRPGILVLTASKAQVTHTVCICTPQSDEDDAKGAKTRWYDFAGLATFLHAINDEHDELGDLITRGNGPARAIIFVDEDEDSYWYTFDARKSSVNAKGSNDLNDVISEFFRYFDLSWSFAFEHDFYFELAAKVYDYLEVIAGTAADVKKAFQEERLRVSAQSLALQRRVALFRGVLEQANAEVARQFTDAQLEEVLLQLIERNDRQSEFRIFNQKAWILKEIRSYVQTLTIPGAAGYNNFAGSTSSCVGRNISQWTGHLWRGAGPTKPDLLQRNCYRNGYGVLATDRNQTRYRAPDGTFALQR